MLTISKYTERQITILFFLLYFIFSITSDIWLDTEFDALSDTRHERRWISVSCNSAYFTLRVKALVGPLFFLRHPLHYFAVDMITYLDI